MRRLLLLHYNGPTSHVTGICRKGEKSCEKSVNEMTDGEESRLFIFSNALSAFSVQV